MNTYITTGISQKKINKDTGLQIKGITLPTQEAFMQLLKYIKENNTGRDIDIVTCQHCINSFDSNIQDFLKSIVTKSLKIGLDAKTANKIYGKDFIPTWEVQLGSAYDKLKLKPNEYFYLGRKLNGNRCSFLDGKLISRQGKEFTGLQHIIDDINRLGLQDFFVDGELIRKNTDNVSDGENFRVGTGIINSDDADKSLIKLIVFDFFPANQLPGKQSKEKYSRRKELLLRFKRQIEFNHLENIDVVEMVYEGTDKSEIDKWLEYAVQNDWEGLMLNKDTVYQCKRTTNLIKIKKFNECDIFCENIVEGDGKYKNTLGSIICDYKGFKLSVGSGFTDEQRNFYYSNPCKIVGKIVTIKYKEESCNKSGGLSLQFPVFITVRADKNSPSHN